MVSSVSSLLHFYPQQCIDYRHINHFTFFTPTRFQECVKVWIYWVIPTSSVPSIENLDAGELRWPKRIAKTQNSIEKNGLYHFKCMPFLLENFPGTFQRQIDIVLSPAWWKSALVYFHLSWYHSFLLWQMKSSTTRYTGNKVSMLCRPVNKS